MPRGSDWKEKELETYIQLYEESAPVTLNLSQKLENVGVKEFLDKIISEIKNYVGVFIQDLPSFERGISYSYENIKMVLKDEDVEDITFNQLKHLEPLEYYKLIGYDLRLILSDQRYSFIEL